MHEATTRIRILEKMGEDAGVSLPLPHSGELPDEEKRAAVRGALILHDTLSEELDANLSAMVNDGVISREVADTVFEQACVNNGTMMNYVHVLVGFVGNHGEDVEL